MSATVTVAACTAYSVTVGAGGSGRPADTNADGGTGGQSLFKDGSTLMAQGGGGGSMAVVGGGGSGGGPAGDQSTSVGTTKYPVTLVATRSRGRVVVRWREPWAAGGAAERATSAVARTGGAAGGTITGGAGGSAPNSTDGNPGNAPGGGGGGGASSPNAGAAGARGEVWVGV